jgi:hypothetical protein
MGIKTTSRRIVTACSHKLGSFGRLMWRGNPEEARKPVPHWFHFPMQIIIAGFILYWHWNLPLPNKAVLGLAALAALMVLAEMRPIHKFIYVLLVLALVTTENRAIKDDRAKFEHEEAGRRQEQNSQFSEIVNDLKSSINLSQEQFSETMRNFGENVNTITGGNSFAVVWAPLIPISSTNTFPLVLGVHGRYDLQDVRIEVSEIAGTWFWHGGVV